MGPKLRVVKRPPLDSILASYMSPGGRKLRYEFTLRTPEGEEFVVDIFVFGLLKDENHHVKNIDGDVRFLGYMIGPVGGHMVVGNISPQNSRAWVSAFDDTPYHIKGSVDGMYGPVFYADDVVLAINNAITLSKELLGVSDVGAQIALSVVQSLSSSLMQRRLNPPAPDSA